MDFNGLNSIVKYFKYNDDNNIQLISDKMNFVPKEVSKKTIQRLLDERDRLNAEKREEYRKKNTSKTIKKNS